MFGGSNGVGPPADVIGPLVAPIDSLVGKLLAERAAGFKLRSMRFGPKRHEKLVISRKAEIQSLAVIFTICAIPLITVLWVVGATTRPDLSDLTPIQNSSAGAIVLNWSILLR